MCRPRTPPALPDKRLTRVFGVIDKEPLRLGTGAALGMASVFDSNLSLFPRLDESHK